jgi:hypothetical protein
MASRNVDIEIDRNRMKPHFHLNIIFLALCAAIYQTPAAADDINSAPPEAHNLPLTENLMRFADLVLMEPGYAQARELATRWKNHVEGFATSAERGTILENLANSRAIVSYLKSPDGPLAPIFEIEAQNILSHFGNGALRAWRFRSLEGKILLAHNAKDLEKLDTSVARREIGPRYFMIPLSSMGFNYSLDAEWDITRLPDYPLSQVNSEYFFLQTDSDYHVTGMGGQVQFPDSLYQFVSGDKFLVEPSGIQNGFRFYQTKVSEQNLIICYPFAGYSFYVIRGLLAFLLLAGLIWLITKLSTLRKISNHVLENRSGQWLTEHYQQSLQINERALGLADKTAEVVTVIKNREQEVFSELGRQLQRMNDTFAHQTEQIEMAVATGASKSRVAIKSPQDSSEIIRPLHKKTVRKAAILIDSTLSPEVDVSIELDLPLTDEKPRAPAAKAGYLQSLKRRASEKKDTRDFVHDELLDNYDYTPPEPMPLPDISLPTGADTADLDYVQKFRYSGKTRVLPMAAPEADQRTLRMREDLAQQRLVVSEDE